MVAWIPVWLCDWVGGGFSIHYPSASPKPSLEFHGIKLQKRNVHGVSWSLLSSLPMASDPEALEAGFGPTGNPSDIKIVQQGQVVVGMPAHISPHRRECSLLGNQNSPSPALMGPPGGVQGHVEGT